MTFLLATISGVLAFLSFPRFGWWPLVFVAHLPLMVALEGQTARSRFVHGWLTGVVFTLGMQYWVAGTMVTMSGFPWWAAICCLLIYAAFIGLQMAVFAWAYGPIRQWSGRRAWLVTVPLAYVVLERVFPALFPFTLASALFEVPVLLQTAAWWGMSGCSWLVMLVACGFLHTMEDFSRRRTSDHLVLTAIAALWLIVSVFGVVQMRQVWTAPVKGRPTLVLVQPNVTVAEKVARDRRVREYVYERTAAMTRETIGLRPDLIVWPEGGFPFQFQVDASTTIRKEGRHLRYSNRLYALALEMGVDMVVGSLRTVNKRVRNSIVHLPKGGARAEVYDKRLLLSFGERVPFGDTFPWLRDKIKGMSHHEPGSRFRLFNAAGFRWTPSVCYEAIFAGFTRSGLNHDGGADVLLNLTNDVWFGDTAAAELHLMDQAGRAVENRVWLVRSTNSGISAFVDPTGTIRARTEVNEETVLAAEIDLLALDRSFYRKHGDMLLYLAILLCLLHWFWRNLQHRRNKRAMGGVSPAGPEIVDTSG